MQSVLITGIGGFIGSHLAEKFLEENFNVIGIDNFLTGRRENLKNIEGKIELLEIDLSIPSKLDVEVDFIVHLASPASPKDYFRYPIETLLVNSIGTHNILELAKRKEARVVIASTSEVYGDPKVHPQNEEYWGNVNPIGVRSVYDESKRFSEALSMAYRRKYELDVRIIRIFNTYGPRMKHDDGRVIPTFITKALKGEPLPIYGDGTQTRSYCYIDDLVEGIYKVSIFNDLSGEVINLGNPEEYSVLETAKIILELTGSSSKLSFQPPLEDDPKQRCPDISKAQKLLDWRPKVSFREGLLYTIEYFKGVLKDA